MAEQSNIRQEINTASVGMNQDQSLNQIKKGGLTYALNAAVENFDGNSVTYQNELGNELCVTFPLGYRLIGHHNINEQTKHILFLANPDTGGSQIGYIEKGSCEYKVIVNSPCLNFSIDHPIHKVAHRITNCSTEIYWTDGYNPRRYLDINDIPKILKSGAPLCDPEFTDDVDCNQLRVQPNFSIPSIRIEDVVSGGDLIAGTYQFAVQYSDALGNPYTSYYSITNPVPIADISVTTPNFNYPVGKSIVVNVSSLDTTGMFTYFNLAVIKTINATSSAELVGTYSIEKQESRITYTGQGKSDIRLAMEEIFEKFPYYDIAQDLTTAKDILIWDQLSSIDRINYQKIASKVHLHWETWRLPPGENYASEYNAVNYKGYLRDEVYPFELVFQLRNGKETDSFHIPARAKGPNEAMPNVLITDADFVGEPEPGTNYSPYWKIYNTASVSGTHSSYSTDPKYKGPYQWGEFAYWESTEQYPCNQDVWGDLAGTPIRHHKFPDVIVSPIFEGRQFTTTNNMTMGDTAIFPIGVKVDVDQIRQLITDSDLTQEQKDDIVGFKIVRGDRSSHKSIIAKGILRNVNSYEKDEKKYYFPNYPYNDLNEDPFLNIKNNAFSAECEPFVIVIDSLEDGIAIVQYFDCNTNKLKSQTYNTLGDQGNICSIGRPTVLRGKATISYANYDTYYIKSEGNCSGFRVQYNDITEGIKESWIGGWGSGDRSLSVKVVIGSIPMCVYNCNKTKGCEDNMQITFTGTVITDESCVADADSHPLPGPTDGYRQVFNSPETSFGSPFLGDILKLESVIYGKGKAHFVEVKNNAKYKLISKEAQVQALEDAARLAGLTDPFSAEAMFTAYQAYLTIFVNGITRRNYAQSFNSIASYDYYYPIENNYSIKQRSLDISKYLVPAVTSVGDDHDINNYQRETSVYLKIKEELPSLPFPHQVPTFTNVVENSRFTISTSGNCDSPSAEEDIQVVSYYASLKNNIVNQWGQIYSYNVIDTGLQVNLDDNIHTATAFGGDTFISRFAFKTKVPFFFDNRVGAPDDSDVFYDEIGNIAYPKYWHSSRSILEDFSIPQGKGTDLPGILRNVISYKAHNFDCPNSREFDKGTTTTTTTVAFPPWQPTLPSGDDVTVASSQSFYDGYFYLFAYGIPNFYCESSYNTDLRQAFNNREGDFWPHVSHGIPDDWVQESFVSIANDNTYYYNTTFSKQNKENTFTHLPADWEAKLCFTHYPFRCIYSDSQDIDADNRVNAWRTYRAISYFDFPQNYGKLIALDGIQNSAILARFENKTLLYNNLLTIDTSNPQAAFIGNGQLFKGAPPIDFAETDLGYVGTQNKMLLKIPEGQISVDAKRGQVFLIQGTDVTDLSAVNTGMNKFFARHLPFEILNYFPEIETDNHYNGIGLHGVYDSFLDRIIITKRDYVPLVDGIKWDGQNFYIEETVMMNIPIPTTTTTTTII